MGYNKFLASLLRSESVQVFLKRRHGVPGIFCTAKYGTSTSVKKDQELDDELDKPIKYSTSKAASWPAEYSNMHQSDAPSYQPTVVVLSVMVFYIYFTVFREENDIDEKMLENIPIEIQEQIYGKHAIKHK